MVTILIKRYFIEFFSSLRWKLFITYFLVAIIPLLFIANTFYKNLDNYFIEERKIELKGQANIMAVRIASANFLFDESKNKSFEYEISSMSKQGGFRVVVLDKNGNVVQDSNGTDIGKTYLIPEVIEALESRDVAVVRPNDLIYAATSIVDGKSNNQSDKIGVVLIVDSTNDIKNSLKEVKNQAFLLTFITLIIVFIVVFFISKIITDPLKNVLDVITEISEGHLDKRAEVGGLDEISHLAESINNMADKLEQVDASRHNFVSNVSHELKTPLSSIKVLCESILFQEDTPKETYVEFLMDINSEVDRMAAIINDLLTLVKIDQKEIPIEFTPSNINEIIKDVLKRLKPLADEKEVELSFEAAKEICANVDEMKFALAVSNLIDNGIKYTNYSGRVKVTLSSDHQNMFIAVSDNGVGIDDKELPKIFERFYRVDKTRDRETGGTGLGLSITHSIVLLHSGSIKVTSKENEGSTFTIRVPLNKIS